MFKSIAVKIAVLSLSLIAMLGVLACEQPGPGPDPDPGGGTCETTCTSSSFHNYLCNTTTNTVCITICTMPDHVHKMRAMALNAIDSNIDPIIDVHYPDWLVLHGVDDTMQMSVNVTTTSGNSFSLSGEADFAPGVGGSIAFFPKEPPINDLDNAREILLASDGVLSTRVEAVFSYKSISVTLKDPDTVFGPFEQVWMLIDANTGNVVFQSSQSTSLVQMFRDYLNTSYEHVTLSDFGNPNAAVQNLEQAAAYRERLLAKTETVLSMISEGDYRGALEKLENDIMAKMDGANGGNPKNDWVISTDAKMYLYDSYDRLHSILEYTLF